jgi:uncharacterized protein HemX
VARFRRSESPAEVVTVIDSSDAFEIVASGGHGRGRRILLLLLALAALGAVAVFLKSRSSAPSSEVHAGMEEQREQAAGFVAPQPEPNASVGSPS